MHTIAVVNEKGGTCKTTTAVNLAAALGAIGHKVLLVDLDGQAASSRWLGVEGDTSFAEALYNGKGLCPLKDVMPNVSLAPASGKLDAVAHDLRPTQGGQLRKLLREVESEYEYCIIDCPPSLGNRLIGNALLAASHAIVPVETSILALDGLKILLTTLDDVREGFGHNIVLAGVLACRFDARTRLSHLVLAELKRALPGKVFDTVIRENVRMRECPASSKSILDYASDSHAAEDYRALANELVNSNRLAVTSDAEYRSDQAAIQAAEETMRLGESLRISVGNLMSQQSATPEAVEAQETVAAPVSSTDVTQIPQQAMPQEGHAAPLPSLAVPLAAEVLVQSPEPASGELPVIEPVPESHVELMVTDSAADIIAAVPVPEKEIVTSSMAPQSQQLPDVSSVQESLSMPDPENWETPASAAATQDVDADCPNLRRMLETIDWSKVEPHPAQVVNQPEKRGLLRRFLGK